MTIDILGLGESLSLYTPSQNITFGVNDIFRKQSVDYLVCVDKKTAFTEDRLKVIKESYPKIFYSQLDEWNFKSNFQRIELQNHYPDSYCNLNVNAYPKSTYSPFVAIAIAFKQFRPDIINLYGVDFITHQNFKDTLSRDRILRHTQNLKKSLKDKDCSLIIHGDGLLSRLE